MDRPARWWSWPPTRGCVCPVRPPTRLVPPAQTLWKAVEDGAVGDVRMVYAEFDDNPIYLLSPESWRSRSGAPWPYLHEYEMGCTWEHVGYHLTWMCAIFGPVRAVTAFSKVTVPDKTDQPLNPADTPDFSVACLDFESGVVGGSPVRSPRPLITGCGSSATRGMLHADTYRHYACPVKIGALHQTQSQRPQGPLGAHDLMAGRGHSVWAGGGAACEDSTARIGSESSHGWSGGGIPRTLCSAGSGVNWASRTR